MVHLFVNSFVHPDAQRNAEMTEALARNRACRHIDQIHEVTGQSQPTIGQLLDIARAKVGWADVAIIANSDVYFDETAFLLNHIGYDECFALARYEGEQGDQLVQNPHGAQDAWVFRGPPPMVEADYSLGQHAGDNRLNRLLKEAGYAIYNPSRSIKIYHLHASGVRPERTDETKIPGEVLYVPPCAIQHIRHRPTDPIVTPGRIAIIQLGRLGDITNSLPIAFDMHRQGHEVFWYVRPEFAALLEGASYVTPVPWNGPLDQPALAVEDATKHGYDRVFDIQIEGNPKPSPVKTANYSSESWARAGYLDKYHTLPCVFDRAQLPPGDWKPAGSKPILAHCLDAVSSPFAEDLQKSLLAWLQREFRSAFTFMPVGSPVWRPDTLAAVLRECRVLLCADSFPLHIGYAAGIPTIALTNQAWRGSEPRRNWIEHLTYAQTTFVEGREIIADALQAVIEDRISPSSRIYPAGNAPAHAYSQARKLSILVPCVKSNQAQLQTFLDRLVPQVMGHQEVEVLVEMDDGQTDQRHKQSVLLDRACGEYCCFMNIGDRVSDDFVSLIIQALLSGPDCVGFKVGRYRAGKLEQVERHATDFESDGSISTSPDDGEIPYGISHLCPVRMEIVRRIGLAKGEEEYRRSLLASELIESEQFIDAVIYARAL